MLVTAVSIMRKIANSVQKYCECRTYRQYLTRLAVFLNDQQCGGGLASIQI